MVGRSFVSSLPFDSANPEGKISVELKGRTRIRSSEIWIHISGGVILIGKISNIIISKIIISKITIDKIPVNKILISKRLINKIFDYLMTIPSQIRDGSSGWTTSIRPLDLKSYGKGGNVLITILNLAAITLIMESLDLSLIGAARVLLTFK